MKLFQYFVWFQVVFIVIVSRKSINLFLKNYVQTKKLNWRATNNLFLLILKYVN